MIREIKAAPPEIRLRYRNQLRGHFIASGWTKIMLPVFDCVEAEIAAGRLPADFKWSQIKEK